MYTSSSHIFIYYAYMFTLKNYERTQLKYCMLIPIMKSMNITFACGFSALLMHLRKKYMFLSSNLEYFMKGQVIPPNHNQF